MYYKDRIKKWMTNSKGAPPFVFVFFDTTVEIKRPTRLVEMKITHGMYLFPELHRRIMSSEEIQ